MRPRAGAERARREAAVAAAAATRASRWYVTAAFTTFLVFLLLFADPDTAGSRFGERVGETLLGVGLAYAFGLALPALAQRRERVKE